RPQSPSGCSASQTGSGSSVSPSSVSSSSSFGPSVPQSLGLVVESVLVASVLVGSVLVPSVESVLVALPPSSLHAMTSAQTTRVQVMDRKKRCGNMFADQGDT